MFGVCAAWAGPRPNKSQGEYSSAQVITDGAAVYSKPDFDSPVQDYLGFQTKVGISRKPYAGQGGMGLFHRVTYKDKVGYIPDTDVHVTKDEGKGSNPSDKGNRADKKADNKNPSKAFQHDKDSKKVRRALYTTRFLGVSVASVDYTEKFSGHKLSDNMLMFGARMMGPGTLFDGPPLDLTLWGSVQKPGYLKRFGGSPSGFLLFGDLATVFPLVNSFDTLLSYSLGIMWVYTRYVIPVKSGNTGQIASFDSQELRAGVDIGLGMGHRFGTIEVRADAKYYVEKTSYPGYGVSFLLEF